MTFGLVGIAGKAGTGKDTVADHLVDKYSFVKRGFADPLYEEVASAFNVSVEWLRDRTRKEHPQPELTLHVCSDDDFVFAMLGHHGDFDAYMRDANIQHSPRWILQKWGTEYRRAQDERYWLKKLAAFIELSKMDRTIAGVVVPDVRFENECEFVRANGGIIWHVSRNGVKPVAAHASEAGIAYEFGDKLIPNNTDLLSLYDCVRDAIWRIDGNSRR